MGQVLLGINLPRQAVVTVQDARRDAQNQFFPFRSVRLWFDSVQAQEHDALIAIDEGMVKVIEISRRHLDQVSIRRFSSETGLRGRNCRFQKGDFPYAACATKPRNRFCMNFTHDFDGKMGQIIRGTVHASFFIVRA